MPKRITASHSRPAIYGRRYCSPDEMLIAPPVELEITYEEGREHAALATLDAAYADVKRQITGMATLVHAPLAQDA